MKNASLTVVHAGSKRTLIEISKIDGSLPIAGDPAQAALKIDSVSAFGNELAHNLAAQLDWTYPLLSLKPLETEIGGHKFVLAGRIASFSGLPIQIDAQLPRQALAAVRLPFDGQATAEAIAANARFRGLLLAPGTWQGDLVAESVSPSIRVGSRETKFDRGSAELLRMQHGGCHAIDGCKGPQPFAGASFKYLAASTVDERTGRTLFPPYHVKHFEGIAVAFIGLTLKDTPTIVVPSVTHPFTIA